MTSPRPGEQGGQVPQERYRDAEAQLGGADAVEKTTYVTGNGTAPEGRKLPGEPAARTSAGGGRILMWIVIAAVVLLVIGYLGGIFR